MDAQRWHRKHMGQYHLAKEDQPLLDDLDTCLGRLKEGIYLVKILGIDTVEDAVDHVVVL